MFRRNRREQIVAILDAEGSVEVEALATRFSVSVDSIRKDLQVLAREGRCERYYGGARRIGGPALTAPPSPAPTSALMGMPSVAMPVAEMPVAESVSHAWPWNEPVYPDADETMDDDADELMLHARKSVAQRAYMEINDGDSIFLDISRTNSLLAGLIAEGSKRVLVTTNMDEVRQKLQGQPHVTVLSTGSMLNVQPTGSMSSASLSLLEPLLFAKAFIGASGVNLDRSAVTSNSIDSGEVKERVIHNASHRFLLVEEQKFYHPGLFRFASITDFSAVITDASDSKILSRLSRIGVPTLRSLPM